MPGNTLPLTLPSAINQQTVMAVTSIDHESHNLSRYRRIIRRHRRLVITIFGASVVAAGIVLYLTPRKYTATSTLLIEPREPQALSLKDLSADSQDINDDDYYYETQYQILKSRTLATQVIGELRLDRVEAFAGPALKPSVAEMLKQPFEFMIEPSRSLHLDKTARAETRFIDNYLKDLTVKPVERSRVVAVSFSAYDPQLAANIVNAHVRAYIQREFEIHADTSRDAEEFLTKKLGELKARLKTSETALNNFRRNNAYTSFSSDGSGRELTARFTSINKELSDIEDQTIKLEAENETARADRAESLPSVIADPVVQRLTESVAALSAQYAAMSNRFGPEYHSLADLRAKLGESKRLLSKAIQDVVESNRDAYQVADFRQAELTRERNNIREKMIAMNDASVQEAVLQREVDINNQLYKSVLARLNEIEVAAEVPVTNISIVDLAQAPRHPSSPRGLLVLAMTAFLAFFGSLGAAMLVDQLDDRFKDPEDLERFSGIRRLGLIPNFRPLRTAFFPSTQDEFLSRPEGQERRALLVTSDGYSIAGEIYRGLRTALVFSSPQNPPRTILITSAFGDEGKTFTTINIGLAFAQMGTRTLIIDGDLRNPGFHQIFGFANKVGLAELLTNRAELSEAIQSSKASELYVMTAGARPSNPGALLGSNKMRALLTTLASQFDNILIDSSSALDASDAVMLSTMVDGVLLVAGASVARTSFRDMCAKLNQVHANIIGTVMNEVELPLATARGMRGRG